MGTATITVTSKVNKKVKATYKITVKNLRYVDREYWEKKYEDWSGLGWYEYYNYAELCLKSYPRNANTAYTITSSNQDVIEVVTYPNYNDSLLVAVGKGTSTITIKSADGFCEYSWKVTVSDKKTAGDDDGWGLPTYYHENWRDY